METKELKINIPEGYEIDVENSTLTCIKFKKKVEINTWRDLKFISGYFIEYDSSIEKLEEVVERSCEDKNIFAYEKYVKAALALAQISQLMPYYGGEITDEEWKGDSCKYSITISSNGNIHKMATIYILNI